jgi:hypothetical protein
METYTGRAKIRCDLLASWAKDCEKYSRAHNVAVWVQLQPWGLVLSMIQDGERAEMPISYGEMANLDASDAKKMMPQMISAMKRRLAIIHPAKTILPIVTNDGLVKVN